MAGLSVGSQAPEFSLPSSTGEAVVLSKQLRQGPVVLAWYLFDFGRI